MKEEVDLAQIAGSCAEFVRPLLAEKDLTLDSQLDPAPCFGHADQLNQVIMNLVANAINYSQPGGSIHLSSGRDETATWLKVSDHGEGIADEHLPHLFERFYRADKARSRGSGGAGLGLAICGEIVAGHGGEIDVQSQVGAGTTFTVRLPNI